MRIDLGWLKQHPGASREFDLQQPVPPLDLGGETVACLEPVQARVAVVNAGDRMVATVQARALLQLQCGRCLEHYPEAVYTEFSFQLREECGPGAEEEADEDTVTFCDDQFDVLPLVLEHLVLEVPLRRVCREECRGICPGCGVDLNTGTCQCRVEETDPRWDALKKLLEGRGE